MLAQAAKQQRLQAELGVLKGRRDARLQEEQERQARERSARLRALKRQESQRQQAQQRRRALLAAYHEQLAERRRLEEQQEREQQEREQQEAAARQAVNRERVMFRKALTDQRAQEQEQARLAAEQAERERQDRLARLRATVLVHVESDPDRILAPTASWLAEAPQEGAPGSSAFRSVNGYTTDELMRDPRFKLQLHLSEKGMLQGAASDYARQLLANTRSNRLTRADNLTTNQIDALVGGRSIF